MTSLDTAASQPQRGGSLRRRAIGYFFMVFGMFMAILDIQIVSSSISKIQAGLSASANEVSWVQTSYLIAEVVMIPLSGWLSRLLSTRILFVISAAGFTFMSVLCASATSIEEMIVYRALQGFLGGAMIPTVFATAYSGIFPPGNRATLSVMIGLVATLAPTIGPTLGGYLTDAFSWHWLFLINVVPGVIVATMVWLLIDIDEPDWSLLDGFDGWGIGLMAVFLGSLEYVLEEGPRHDWFEDDTIWWLAVVCVISGSFFLARMFTYERPIVDLRAYRDRNFAIGSLMSLFLGVGLYGLTYLYPLFLAMVRDLSASQIGVIMFVTGICQFFAAPIAGSLVTRVDVRLLIAFGFSMLAISNYMLIGLTWEWDYWQFFLPQAIRGFGLMFCIVPINGLALGTLPQEQLKNASGLYNLMRNLGGAVGLALINTVLITRTDLHKSNLRESVEAGRPAVEQAMGGLGQMISGTLGAAGDLAAMKTIHSLMMREATVMAFADCFFILSVCFVLMLLPLPTVRRPDFSMEADSETAAH